MHLLLVVEDEHGNAEILKLVLEAEGYRVATASNGKQALEMLKDGERPSLIISDYMMPLMNGGEFGLLVRQEEALRQIPFVFMSATSEDLVKRAFADYDEFLAKPIELTSLLQVVKHLLATGRTSRPSDKQVEDSMRHLLKGIRVPTRD